MKKNLYLIGILSLVCLFPAVAQDKITGLSNVKLYLDPGHSQKENQGLYKYSEAEKTLRVAKAIKEYLLAYTDMQEANIRLCREDDNVNVPLDERTDAANAWGADFYYSIHSDAGSPSANSTLFMYGGWRVNGVIYEKTPSGGKDYGDILTPNLTGVMGLTTRGNLADRTFYFPDDQTHTLRYPYLHVNRESNMASLLSEAGFHTNPFQQARNLNADYKRLEGYAAFQSLALFLRDHFSTNPGGTLPAPGIAFGTVKNNETNELVNDARITINDGSNEKVYVTDGYDSLFKNYSNKPDEIHNGFFFFEGLTPGATATIKVEVNGYESQQTTVTIPATLGITTVDGMAVKDFSLTNITAPVVKNVEYTGSSLEAVAIDKPMTLTFSRKMDKTSVESAISLSPAGSISYLWINDYILNIDLSLLDFQTAYTLKIDGSIAKNSLTGQYIDGNNDGTAGDDYILNFATGEQDVTPPYVVSYDPQDNLPLTVEVSRPIVRIQFSEYLNEDKLAPNQITVTDPNGETVGGVQKYTDINHIGVLHYFFTADLQPNKTYTVHLAPGVEDLYGNAITTPLDYSFTVKPRQITPVTTIDDFEGAMGWPVDPKQNSGSTSGVVQEKTTVALESSITASTDSQHGMILNYQWSDDATAAKTIRFTKSANTPKFDKVADNTMRIYVFGDASNSSLRLTVREGGAGTIWSCKPILIDWAGWRLISWNPETDGGEAWLVGTTIPTGASVNFACFGLHGSPADQLSLVPSYIVFDDIQIVKVGDYLGTSIPEVKAGEISVTPVEKAIQIAYTHPINDVRIYSISGALAKAAQPGQTSVRIPTDDLPQGVYVVKVAAGTAQKTVKVIVNR